MTEPRGPIDWANQQQAEREQRPARHTADTITSDALDQLYAERDEARAAADRYFTNGTKAVEGLNWRAHNAEQRAEQAEAERDKACTAFNAKVMQLEKAERAVNLLADSHRRAEQAERTIERMKRTNRMVNGCARDARLRAEQAEAAIARVRAVIAAADWPHAQVYARDVRAALDEPKEPRPPAVHIGNRANAEDCPACSGTNPDYPFICPGPETP